ncbi:MAG: hypothetical protein CMF19_09840 [Idiomarinaceae bacterium]|nr:hypothetical protein [Idiomarinaceae bacterium]
MPKFNFESALTWTWAVISVLVVGIYLGLIFGESGAIDGTFFDLIGALTSLGILAIGYQGLHSWRIQDRSKMRREYAREAIGHLTRALEVRGQFTIPVEAQMKVNEAYYLLRARESLDYNEEIERLMLDGMTEAQSRVEKAIRNVPEYLFSAKSAVICVSREIYFTLDDVERPFHYHRVKTPTQMSDEMPELLSKLINSGASGGGAFFLLYDYLNLDSVNQQFREIENIIDILLYVVEHGELKNDAR